MFGLHSTLLTLNVEVGSVLVAVLYFYVQFVSTQHSCRLATRLVRSHATTVFTYGWLLAVTLTAWGAVPAAAEIDMTYCALLMQFEDEPGLLQDAAGAHPPGQASQGVSAGQGRYRGGCRLEGEAAWVDLGNNFGAGFSTPRQTISVWVRPREFTPDAGEGSFILGTRNAPERGSWRWNLTVNGQGCPSFRTWDNAQEEKIVIAAGDTPLPTGEWTHLAVVMDAIEAETVTLFVNGEPAATATLLSNSPHGHLFIGSVAPNHFVGDVDEVALFEAALSPEQVRELAQAQVPLEAGRPAEMADGFWLKPIEGMHHMIIGHTAVPTTRWMLRLPEYTYRIKDGRWVTTAKVLWEREPGTNVWRFHWAANDEEKQMARLDFEGEVTVHENVVDFSLTVRNVGDDPWEHRNMGLFCFKTPESPDFTDYEAERTWVRRDGQWMTMGEVVNHEFADHRMCGVGVGEGAGLAERLAAKGTVDGRFLMGIATDIARSLSFNFQTTTNCMHSNPGWDMLQPGQEQTATGKVYFLEGTLYELYELYLADFDDEDDGR